MPDVLGHSVPKVKAIMSHDTEGLIRQNVLMDEEQEKLAETQWRTAFQARVRQLQGKRTAKQMATILGMSRTSYSKVIGARMDQLPIRCLPTLAALGDISIEELIDGPEAKPAPRPQPGKKQKSA